MEHALLWHLFFCVRPLKWILTLQKHHSVCGPPGYYFICNVCFPLTPLQIYSEEGVGVPSAKGRNESQSLSGPQTLLLSTGRSRRGCCSCWPLRQRLIGWHYHRTYTHCRLNLEVHVCNYPESLVIRICKSLASSLARFIWRALFLLIFFFRSLSARFCHTVWRFVELLISQVWLESENSRDDVTLNCETLNRIDQSNRRGIQNEHFVK